MTYKFETKLIRDPIKPESDDWQETAHKWMVSINGQSFDYYTGVAHREKKKGYAGQNPGGHTYEQLSRMNLTQRGFDTLLILSKAKPPSLDDVLHALCLDAEAAIVTFREWCDNFGYDTDSRKALNIYEQCQDAHDKLIRAKVDIEKERERLQDY